MNGNKRDGIVTYQETGRISIENSGLVVKIYVPRRISYKNKSTKLNIFFISKLYVSNHTTSSSKHLPPVYKYITLII